MSVLGRLASMFGRRKPAAAGGAVPYTKVRMEVGDEGVEGGNGSVVRPDEPTPRSRQEALAELQRNYNEVIELVRKMGAHLDRESTRSARMLELAERIPEAIELLSESRGQNERMIDALRSASESARKADAQIEQALVAVRERLDEASESDAQLVGTLAEFRGSLREMADASSASGRAIQSMNERNAQRDAELSEILTVTRRWIIAALVLGAVGVAAAVVSVALFVIQNAA